MTHQNLIPQSRYFMKDYVVHNHEEVQRVLMNGGVALNLSGHSHLQHTSVSGPLTDICTECAAVYPLSFGELAVSAGRTHAVYSRRLFEVDRSESKKRLAMTITRMVAPSVEHPDIPSDAQKRMLDFAREVAVPFYTGDLNDSSLYIHSPEWDLWKTYAGSTFWGEYIETILTEFMHE